MSLYHVSKSLRRCLLFDQHLTSLSSQPQDIHFCFPFSHHHSLPTTHERTNCSYDHSHNNEMDVLDMNDHFNAVMLRSELDSSKPSGLRKDRSSLIESFRRNSIAAQSSPSLLSLDTNVATLSSLSLSSTLSSASSLSRSELSSPSSLSLSHYKQPIPFYVSCFSPLDLPSDIFVYMLQFFSPADLWRLCQVSHGMQTAISGYMSKIQRFKYGAVRILHQENLESSSTQALRGHTLYEHMAHAASSSSFTSPRGKDSSNQVQNRSTYWMSQARYLVGTINEGADYELRADNSPEKGACTEMSRETSGRRIETLTPASSAASSSVDLLDDHHQEATATSQPSAAWSTETLVLASPHSSTWSLNTSEVSLTTVHKQSDVLPLDRFRGIVDIVFDPNLVHLNHRRAIINCARYVSASIDESYLKLVHIQDPTDPIFNEQFLAKHYVRTGPYLTLFSPIPGDADGLELSPKERTPAESIRSKIVTPPRKLHNYFQVMLWHRCLRDLVSLYNRVQSRHTDEPLTGSCHSQDNSESSPSSSADIYPFCCKAHSLVFTTQYPFSIVPYSFRVHFRRMARKVQSVSNKGGVFSNAFGEQRGGSVGRRIRYTGPTTKLRFCDSGITSQSQGSAPASPTQHAVDFDDEALLQRRYRVEEQIRRDNLDKQELLALCHMACGLFVSDDRSPNPPPTLMALLRHGSPWSKGVWREGEWQHTPIDVARQRNSSSQESLSSAMNMGENGSKADAKDMGRWQKLCIAAIQFLAQEDLGWGGNKTNPELSRLRATSNATSWTYHE